MAFYHAETGIHTKNIIHIKPIRIYINYLHKQMG